MKGMCRLCLDNDANFYIFSENSTIHEKLLSYCKLKIYKDDGLPEKVCSICLQQLDIVVEFINKCEESDRILRNENVIKPSESFSVKIEKDSEEFFSSSINFHEDINKENLSVIVKDELTDDCKPEELFDYPKSELELESPIANIITKTSKRNKLKGKKSSSKKRKSKKIPDDSSYDIDFDSDSDDILCSDILSSSEIKSDLNDLPSNAKVIQSESNTNPLKKRKRKKKGSETKSKRKYRKSKFDDESSLCPFCGKNYPHARALRIHIQRHSGIRHKCSTCPKTFSTRELRKVHEQRHLGIVKVFPCEVCGNTFSTSYECKKHFQTVHQRLKAVACKICDKVLSNSRGLSEHMKIHTGEKKFECQLCQRKFTHKLSLTCHIRVHTGEQPYSCQYCEKRFSIGKSLKEHERLHTGEKPYVCPICPKRFEQLSNMKSHFRYNHKGLDFKQAQEAAAAAKSSKNDNDKNNYIK